MKALELLIAPLIERFVRFTDPDRVVCRWANETDESEYESPSSAGGGA